jgi:ubiquinone/menaquinone biosynthesis C-methylase UbiE
VDSLTIETYDRDSALIGALHAGLIPERLYELVKSYFIPGGITADIGCGIGRDTFWLSRNGFSAIGYDASRGMLNEARRRYPDCSFTCTALPELPAIPNAHFDNILCSAVLMHLPLPRIPDAITNLSRIAKNSGVILLSFRDTSASDLRESGKLYSPIDTSMVTQSFLGQGVQRIYNEAVVETERNHIWDTLVFRKSAHSVL